MPALGRQLVHATVQGLEKVLHNVTDAHAAFVARAFGAQGLASDAIALATAFAGAHGPVTLAETLASLRAQYLAIGRGRDPVTGAKMPTPMREMQLLLMDGVLRDAGALLRDRLQPELALLKDGRDQMSHALLAGLQAGLITAADLTPRQTIDGCMALWTRLCTDPQIALLDTKLRLKLHPSDLTLLVFDLWSALKVPPLPSTELSERFLPSSSVSGARSSARRGRPTRTVHPT